MVNIETERLLGIFKRAESDSKTSQAFMAEMISAGSVLGKINRSDLWVIIGIDPISNIHILTTLKGYKQAIDCVNLLNYQSNEESLQPKNVYYLFDRDGNRHLTTNPFIEEAYIEQQTA